MVSQLSYYIFSILILLIFTSTNVYGVSCESYETTCGNYPNNWCCPIYQYCDYSSESCSSPYTTIIIPTTAEPSSDIPQGITTLGIIVISICSCAMCLRCCIRSQQQQRPRLQQRPCSNAINANTQRVTCPYQQQSFQAPSGVVHARPVSNVNAATPIFSTYEAPPPSYEAAIVNLPPTYSLTPPPVKTTVEDINATV